MTSISDLEKRIRTETEAARAAIKLALQHAANVGLAYGQVRELLTQSQVQAWLADTTCADRHTVMVMRRISKCGDLDVKARTLADLMLDRAAEYIAQGTDALSRSEMIKINRENLQLNPAAAESHADHRGR